MLLSLALIWGASFMFIKVADRQLSPAKYHLLLASRLIIDPMLPRFLNGRDARTCARTAS